MTEFHVSQVRVAMTGPLGPAGVPSGIFKRPVAGPVTASIAGLEGDDQGDKRHHGGTDKAIHAYAVSNYPYWKQKLPDIADRFEPGAFGENLVVEGLDEAGLCLGDHWQLGSSLLELSQGRQPCWRLNLRFGQPDMARLVQESGRTGWYFRVIRPGLIRAGETAHLVARPNPNWSVARTAELLYHDRLNSQALSDFAAIPGLPNSWRLMAQSRLERLQVENWHSRIDTPQHALAK